MRHAAFLVAVVALVSSSHAEFIAMGHNFTVKLTITSSATSATYGEETAPDGKQFLVLSATFENVIDAALAVERELPLRATNDNLPDALALVIDGETSVPVASHEASTANLDTEDTDIVAHSGGSTDAAYFRKVVGLRNAAGKRALVYYDLEKPGAAVSGDLLFLAPTTPARSLQLDYHDPIGGDLSTRFLNSIEGRRSVPSPADPPGTQANDVFALAARVSEDPARASEPPPGRRFIAVELRGRSLMKVEDQFPPYDPSHANGETWWRPDPASWIEFRNNLQLVADGALPCCPQNPDDVPETAQFASGVGNRFRLLYLVPAETKALDLICFFPTYTIPGRDDNVTPPAMRFHLAGPKTETLAAPASAEKKIADGPTELFVAKHVLSAMFVGETAVEDERFLVVDFLLRNTGEEGGEFRFADQLVHFERNDARAPDELTARGPSAPPAFFYLPPGETRRFEVVWRVPAASIKKPLEMGLRGNTVAVKFTLPAAMN